jgi:hypothetical protein
MTATRALELIDWLWALAALPYRAWCVLRWMRRSRDKHPRTDEGIGALRCAEAQGAAHWKPPIYRKG